MKKKFAKPANIVAKPCLSYPGYSITRSGSVFTHRKRLGAGRGHGCRRLICRDYWRPLARFIGHGGYYKVSISVDGKQRSVGVHALLMDAFCRPRLAGEEVRHLDGNPRNNAIGNLAYGTRKENAQDRLKNGRAMRGSDGPSAKLTEPQVVLSRALSADGLSTRSLAKRFGVCATTMARVLNRETWKHV